MKHGVEHAPGVARSAQGTPLLDDVFAQAAKRARHELLCYVSADVILLDDLTHAVVRAAGWRNRFVLTGRCTDVDPASLTETTDLRAVAAAGSSRGSKALDYFVFPAPLYADAPPFALGRAAFDNWLLWRARDLGVPVIDATRAVTALHQRHDYAHVPGGFESVYYGVEAQRNLQLAGGGGHLYSLWDASHLMTRRRIRVNPGAWLRARHRVDELRGKAAWRRDALRRAVRGQTG